MRRSGELTATVKQTMFASPPAERAPLTLVTAYFALPRRSRKFAARRVLIGCAGGGITRPKPRRNESSPATPSSRSTY